MNIYFSFPSTFRLILIGIVCFLSGVSVLNAQQDEIATLEAELKNVEDDKRRIVLLNQLAEKYLDQDKVKKAVEYAEQALNVSTDMSEGGAYSLALLGHAYSKVDQFENALSNYIQASQEYEKLGNNQKLAENYQHIGNLIKRWGVPDKALEYYLKTQDILGKVKGNSTTSSLELEEQIAFAYLLTEDYETALSAYQKVYDACQKQQSNGSCIQFRRKIAEIYDLQKNYIEALNIKKEIHSALEQDGTKNELATSFNNLGYAYKKTGNTSEALESLLSAANLMSELPSSTFSDIEKGATQSNIGVLYQNLDDYSNSVNAFEKAANFYKAGGNDAEAANAYNFKTLILIESNNYQSASEANENAISLAEGANVLAELEKAYELQNQLYQSLGESKKALEAYQLFSTIKAKLYAEQVQSKEDIANKRNIIEKIEKDQQLLLADKKQKEIELDNIKLEGEKREKELSLLRKEQELEKTRLEQERLAKEKAEQDLLLARQQIQAEQKDRDLKDLQQAQEISDLKAQQEREKKERLEKENEILEENNNLLAQSDKLKAQALEEEQSRRMYFYLGIVLLLVIMGLILVGFYLKKRDNKKLGEKNVKLEEQQIEINNLFNESQRKNTLLQQRETELEVALNSEKERKKQIEGLLLAVQEKNDQLLANEEELRQNAEELTAINEQLSTTLINLQNTQSQLVQSEKMASLGQLIAGVAHEVNTPLGAIKASIGTISDSLDNSLEMLPRLFQVLNEAQQKEFFALLNRSFESKNSLTSREERKFRRSMRSELEDNGVEDASDIASTMVDIGIYDNISEFLPLIQHVEKDFILQVAYYLALQKRNSSNIELAVSKASKVVFALKSYSRQNQSVEMIKTSIIENIETVLTIYHNQLKQGVEIQKEFQQVPETFTFADELSQVWTNLITNAVQAMNNQGRLDISIYQVGKQIEVKIRDYGPGIPIEIQSKIFDPFFTTKKAGEGSGLGLDIVSKIVEKHNGNISFETEQNEGTTFLVILPILEEPISAPVTTE